MRTGPGLVLAALSACVSPRAAFECATSDQCMGGGQQGSCEPDGFCAFPDPSCPEGRRYGEEAGAGLAGTCVGAPADAAVALADANPLTCGNATPDDGEQCDDGNADDGDGCTDCRFARCGDGHLRAGVEDCDDGNTIGGDACEPSCLDCSAGADSLVWSGNGHCYARFDGPATWSSARAACIAQGGHLASYFSDAESAAGYSVLGGALRNSIGMNDFQTEGAFIWEDDRPLSYTNWRMVTPPPPNGGTAENCGEQFSDDGSWGDHPCGNPAPYLCEWDTYALDPATNHAYRYVGGGALATHAAAAAACAALGGGAHLATIADAAEQAFVQTLPGRSAWLGLDDRASEGTFAWVDGSPLADQNWSGGQPGAATPATDCVSMGVDGTWTVQDCDAVTAAYICEID